MRTLLLAALFMLPLPLVLAVHEMRARAGATPTVPTTVQPAEQSQSPTAPKGK